MGGWSCKDAIGMERRHILEGEKRVARQEAIMRELIEAEHDQLVLTAAEMLDVMREILEFARTRLRDLERHSAEPPYQN